LSRLIHLSGITLQVMDDLPFFGMGVLLDKKQSIKFWDVICIQEQRDIFKIPRKLPW